MDYNALDNWAPHWHIKCNLEYGEIMHTAKSNVNFSLVVHRWQGPVRGEKNLKSYHG